MNSRVSELSGRFTYYVDRFRQARLFTGPSLYFHFRTLKLLEDYGGPRRAAQEERFAETLYATLTSWEMHRMEPKGAKLVEFEEFASGLKLIAPKLGELDQLRIYEIHDQEVAPIADSLWHIVEEFRVSTTATRIVAASKTLHHLLPELVPPIDREYALWFFYQSKILAGARNEPVFKELFTKFHRIAVTCRDEIEAVRGVGMNTSATKIIDNAIVGYVMTHLKGPDGPGARGAEAIPR
jgi:hypothetical protein